MNQRIAIAGFVKVGVLAATLSGCAIPFNLKPPGPKEYQVEASKVISTESVKAVTEAQSKKIEAMRDVAVPVATAKVEAIKAVATETAKNTKDPETLSNINANAMNAIVRVGLEDKVLREIGVVDGTANVVGKIAGKGVESTETSTTQYGMYAAGQTYIGAQAFPEAIKQFEAVKKWGMDTLIPIVAGTVGGGGLIGGLLAALSKSRKRKQLLEADGKTIREFEEEKLKAKDDTALNVVRDIKSRLAKKHSIISIDAKKEHGLI